MNLNINKLILILLIVILDVANAKEVKEKTSKQICNEEIKKEIIDKSIVNKYCLEVAREYENNEDYGGASWYYLLYNTKYNIANIKQYTSLKKSTVIYSNIAHSYVLNNDIEEAKPLYKEFLNNYNQPNKGTQEDFELLYKIYPNKKEQITKGLELWNDIYKLLLPTDDLYKKHIQAKKNNDNKSAAQYLEKIIEIKEKVLGKENISTAKSYNNIGALYSKINNYPKVLEYYKKSLVIKEKVLGKENISTSIGYNNIGLLYQDMNDYPKALEYFKKSLVIKEKVLGKEHTDTALSYNNLGSLYDDMNDYPKALEYYKKSLVIKEKVFGKEHISTATSYNNIGSFYKAMNDYPKALEYYKKSLVIKEKVLGKEHTDTALSYNNIGSFYKAMNDYPKALEYYKKSLSIYEKLLGKEHTSTSISYNNIGLLYQYMNDYPKALEYYKKSLEIREKVLGKEYIGTATSYNNLGSLYHDMNDYPKAFEYYKKALSIVEKVLGKNHILTAKSYNNLGSLYMEMNDYPKSLEYYKNALSIDEKVLGKEHTSISRSYNNLGLLYYKMRDHPKAYHYAKKSFNIFLKNRDKNFAILDSKQKLKYVKANSGKLTTLLESSTRYIKVLIKENKKAEAQRIKEDTLNDWLNYKGAVFDSENNMVILYEKVKDKKIKTKIEELNSYKQQLSKLYQTIPKKNERETYKVRIEELEKNISENEIYLSSKLDEFKEELGLRNIKYKDISSKLKDKEIYIDFAKTQDNYFIFTLDNKNNITFEKIDSNTTKNINKNIKVFRENIDTILKSTDLTKEKLDTLNIDAKEVLSNLYEDIVNNLSKTVSNIKTKDTLIFSLDGVLNFLPFEALYDKKNKQYLIEKKNIKYVPSGKEFVRLLNKQAKQSNKRTKEDSVTMFTNPTYGLKLPPAKTKETLHTPNTRASSILHKSLFGMIFSPLPGTVEEAKLISKLYSKAKDYNKDEATSENLFKVNSPKILHISTHGFFLKDKNIKNPMLKAGLAFTGANMARVRGDSQGVVTGLKLAGLNLTNTDLVVLSACETGLGDINEAEGVTGLNKAFIKAGAKNIVMSLWSVADKETAELMKEFYSNIKSTNNYQQSLKDSKLKMIEDNLHPFYWSAFILNGV